VSKATAQRRLNRGCPVALRNRYLQVPDSAMWASVGSACPQTEDFGQADPFNTLDQKIDKVSSKAIEHLLFLP
jgi:hypothetical protein